MNRVIILEPAAVIKGVPIELKMIQVNHTHVKTSFDSNLHITIALTTSTNGDVIWQHAAILSEEMLKLAFAFISNAPVDISVTNHHV